MEKIKQPKRLLSRKVQVYVSKEDKENWCSRLASEGESCQPEINLRKSRRVTNSQCETSDKNNSHLLSHNLPAGDKIQWNKQPFRTR